MEKISQEEADAMIKKSEEEFKQIINEGGKIIKTIITEKDKETTITKIEPVNGEATSSTLVQTKDVMEIEFS